MSELDDLLDEASDADPGDRIDLRDPIAAHGEVAIDAMTDWLADPRLAAFAIRVLERIGRDPGQRPAVLRALTAVDRTELPPHLVGDLDGALAALGARSGSARSAGSGGSRPTRPPGTPGQPGRGYWVMRTSPWERPYIWSEAQAGRLRQGWGVEAEQDLEVIAVALRRGDRLTGLQQEARRALRMLASWDNGIRFGDVVVAPNLPEYGRLSVFRVSGSYDWAPEQPRRFGERFGHVLPVELLEGDINRYGPDVSDGLRAILGVQTRLYNITGYGGDVETLVGGAPSADRWGELWTEAEYETLFRRFPPEGERPSEADVVALAAELGRTHDAIAWQWGDGAAYLRGASASTTSEPLKAWLDRQGVRR
jgi:hypothetical protein